MSMFTTIKSGEIEYQIKCGYDYCETYRLGDKINQYPIKGYPGKVYLADGIHKDTCDNGFVVIKDGIVFAVLPREEIFGAVCKWHKKSNPQFDEENDDLYVYVFFEYLENTYGPFNEPPRELWSENEWTAKEKRDADE